jgi:hypothetical protein
MPRKPDQRKMPERRHGAQPRRRVAPTAEEGGAQHCQRDFLSLRTATMWNWLEEKVLRSHRT